jgi:4-hydroxy-3-methylbut-2-enyl diphosphate reductase
MEIIKAERAGFCFGVANAVDKTFEILENNKESRFVFSYGELIHNDRVIRKLSDLGMKVIKSVDEIIALTSGNPEKATVIIRAHGISPEEMHKIEQLGCEIIDATCPFVSKIHKLVRDEYSAGRKIIIVGDPQHPEVIGTNGWCDGKATILSAAADAEEFISVNKKSDFYSVVAQTTFSKKIFNEICNIIKKYFDNVNFFDTICSATSLRQEETIKIASQADLMIVVGDRKSSNTCKLFDLSSELCENVLFVEDAGELDISQIDKYKKVGVTAGASVPDWIIGEVIGKMSEINQEIENAEITTAEVVEEIAVADDANVACDNESFETLLDKSLTTITSGQIVKGTINKIDSKGVYVDLGFKFEGFIAIDEFTEIPGFEADQLNIGDEVEAMVVKVSDKDGEAILSKRRVDNKKNMILLEQSYESKTPVLVRIKEAVNGGVVAYLGSVRIFIPASQLTERFAKDLSAFVGQTVEVIITAFEKGPKGHNRIVGSRKVILVADREEKEEAFWSKIELDKVCTGVVKSLTPFGAFVDIGGYDGLIHMSELSWNRIKHPSEVLKVGQEVEVKILEFDRKKKRISLGYRKQEDNPWFDAENLYQVGDILEVTIVRFAAFGVFVNIAPGIDGLVHISQISNQRISSAADCLKIGQKVMAKIIDTNIAEKKINLSIRDVQAYDPEPKPVELDEEGNPIVPEKKERPRKKDRGERPAKEKRVKKDAEDEIVADKASSMGTSIGDILAAKLQPAIEVNADSVESETNE